MYYEALLASALGGDGGRVPLGRARVGVEEIHVPCPLVLWGEGDVNRVRYNQKEEIWKSSKSNTYEEPPTSNRCLLFHF